MIATFLLFFFISEGSFALPCDEGPLEIFFCEVPFFRDFVAPGRLFPSLFFRVNSPFFWSSLLLENTTSL